MSYFSQLKIKGIGSGVIAFIVLYFAYSQFVTWSVNSNIENQSVFTLFGYVVWLLSGYLSGIFSKTAGILNGAVVGLLTPVVMVAYMVVSFGGWEHVQESVHNHGLFWLFTGFFLCGIGGLIWDIQRKFV